MHYYYNDKLLYFDLFDRELNYKLLNYSSFYCHLYQDRQNFNCIILSMYGTSHKARNTRSIHIN